MGFHLVMWNIVELTFSTYKYKSNYKWFNKSYF